MAFTYYGPKVHLATGNLAQRYFVQKTPHHTLVTGSLIKSNRKPSNGIWQPIETTVPFHHISYDDNMIVGEFDSGETYTTVEEIPYFNGLLINNILPLVYPNINPETTRLNYKLFYFLGSFQEIAQNQKKLTLVSTNKAYLRLYNLQQNKPTTTANTLISDNGILELQIHEDAPEGDYCLIFAILNKKGKITDYIVLEDVLAKNFVPTE